jgi:hypothetical protein
MFALDQHEDDEHEDERGRAERTEHEPEANA